MNSNYPLIIFTCMALFFSACKKDKNDPVAPVCRVSTIVHYGTDTAYLTYNSQNQITRYNSPGFIVDINYSGLMATSTSTYSDSVHPYLNIFLNNNGTLQSMDQERYQGADFYRITYAFQYDAEQHIIRCEQSSTNYTTHITNYIIDSIVYQNGNMTAKYILRKTSPAVSYTLSEYYLYTYTSDVNNIGYFAVRYEGEPIDMGSQWAYLYPLLGVASKNLPLRTVNYNSAGVQTYSLDYATSLNAEGNPQEQNMHLTVPPPDAPYTVNRKMEYTCN